METLTKEEVKELIWKEFEKFMKGQTVMIGKKGTLYYRIDIDNFLKDKDRRFFD